MYCILQHKNYFFPLCPRRFKQSSLFVPVIEKEKWSNLVLKEPHINYVLRRIKILSGLVRTVKSGMWTKKTQRPFGILIWEPILVVHYNLRVVGRVAKNLFECCESAPSITQERCVCIAWRCPSSSATWRANRVEGGVQIGEIATTVITADCQAWARSK